jgi:thiosulfate/3-mercaptopyruvate sulfurtransferase
MKKHIVLTALILAVLTIGQAIEAQVISVKELDGLLDGGDVVLVSARKPADYKKVHIPGAVSLWHEDFYKEGEIKAMLKSPEEIAAILGSKGICGSKTVVVYDNGKNTFAGRIYWILKYMGVSDVRVLDGHMKMWRKGRKPVTKDLPEITAVEFKGAANPALIATMDQVKANKGVLVDNRDAEEFAGEKGTLERKGHIPGAINFNYKDIVNEDGTIKDKAEIAKLVEAAGITSDKEVILYCETGIRAGIVYMALTSMLEYPNVSIYDGAMMEWISIAENAVDK